MSHLLLSPKEQLEKFVRYPPREYLACFYLYLVVALKVNSRYQEGMRVTRFSDDRGELMQDQWPGY